MARIAGFFWLDEAAMARMIGHETRVNTDNFHYLDKQSAVWPLAPEWQMPQFQTSVVAHVGQLDDELRATIREQEAVARSVGRYGFYLDPRDLLAAWCRMPENGDVRFFMSQAFPDGSPSREVVCRNGARF